MQRVFGVECEVLACIREVVLAFKRVVPSDVAFFITVVTAENRVRHHRLTDNRWTTAVLADFAEFIEPCVKLFPRNCSLTRKHRDGSECAATHEVNLVAVQAGKGRG